MHRKALGRTLIFGFTVSNTAIASGRAAWASPFPTLEGKSRRPPDEYVSVLKYSSPHAILSLRRTERVRVPAASSDDAPSRRPLAIVGELMKQPLLQGHLNLRDGVVMRHWLACAPSRSTSRSF